MKPSVRLWTIAGAFFLGLSPVVSAQAFSHPPHPDPAAQLDAARAQRARLESPNQFGTNCCQILQIPAAYFQEIDRSLAGYTSAGTSTGYVILNGGGIAAEVWAPVTLPSGAALDFLDLYFYDNDAAND